MKKQFRKGLFDALPIGLGYLVISFSVGIEATKAGLSWLSAAIMSLTNLTSAGEVAAIAVIAEGGGLIELALTQLLINCRYSIMALSLSQKLAPKYSVFHRFTNAYAITDEIFSLASSQSMPITPAYMYGMTVLPCLGWTLGTLIGAVCGDILPARLSSAMGILITAMFIAILVPAARTSKANLGVILVAAGVSCIIYYLIPAISTGFSIIISALVAACIMAYFVPVPQESEEASGGTEAKGAEA